MAGTALLPRLTWQPAMVTRVDRESASAVTLRLDVPDWPGHRAGQHIDVRLTAPDGYTAVRPYSLASAGGSEHVDITVDTTPGGEVSTYLSRNAQPGHHVEVRGPLGHWFVWDERSLAPTQLIAGGSGVVPLMSMLRTHQASGNAAPMQLLYSLTGPDQMLYHDELRPLESAGVVKFIYTRFAPSDVTRPAGRMSIQDLQDHVLRATADTRGFVCGPTGFVETVLHRLVALGYDPGLLRAERYGERNESP